MLFRSIGAGGVGSEAAVLQFEQADGPGVTVALLFGTKQKAVGGRAVGADEDGLLILEDFVETAEANVGEILTEVVRPCFTDGILQDVVHGADRQVDAEEVAAKLVDATIGATFFPGPRPEKMAPAGQLARVQHLRGKFC